MTTRHAERFQMTADCRFIAPPKELAACVVCGLYRDTRERVLSDQERVNYFPASPFFSASVMLDGVLHTSDRLVPWRDLRALPVAPSHIFAPPKPAPHMSWSPGPIAGLTVAFFPDAWKGLGGAFDGTPPDSLRQALGHFDANPADSAWELFWRDMARAWSAAQSRDRSLRWGGSSRIRNWTYHLAGTVARSGTGRSLRSAQRRIQGLTGQTMQALNFYAQLEDVHRLATKDPETKPSALAAEAGFADQSHLGRALKRATGFSPAQLNKRIAEDEAFWCYRLLGERF